VLKSRAHFRRGFDDNGFAKTTLIVDAPGPYLGTVNPDALPERGSQEAVPVQRGWTGSSTQKPHPLSLRGCSSTTT